MDQNRLAASDRVYSTNIKCCSFGRFVAKVEPSCDNSAAIGRFGRIDREQEENWDASEKRSFIGTNPKNRH
jgi:hypothetical protein